MTGTALPPPYPWSQTTKDPGLNTATTSWSSGSATPTVDRDDPGAVLPCGSWCDICLLCPPGWSSGGGGGGGSDGNNNDGNDNDDNNDDDDACTTREAEICSTVCVAGSGCEFDCSTTTGCSVNASATSIVGTPAPAVTVTMEQWPESTDVSDSDMTSIARSLDSMLSSMYGDLTVLAGYDDGTATATSTSSATSTASAPPDLPTDLSDVQFVISLRKSSDSLDS
ncbi:uncharacterized protein BDV14DRAFT_204410 [Aspergillus stella-maris]|uniref:uncharacterized protein n=1 Tax=Aspergillus stella-maris TaxID=1810926 RepID=UPI003CCD7F9E